MDRSSASTLTQARATTPMVSAQVPSASELKRTLVVRSGLSAILLLFCAFLVTQGPTPFIFGYLIDVKIIVAITLLLIVSAIMTLVAFYYRVGLDDVLAKQFD